MADSFNGASEADIRAACGFGRSHIYRLITERWLAQHPDGNETRTHGTPLRLRLGHIFSCVSAFARTSEIDAIDPVDPQREVGSEPRPKDDATWQVKMMLDG